MGFDNPIIDGAGALVRTAIKSPNFNPGTAGWQVAQDGSAEFDNVTIRGNSTFEGDLIVEAGAGNQVFVYGGVPALGNLLMSIATGQGQDPYGNWYGQGVKFYSNGLTQAGMQLKSDSTVQLPGVDASVSIDQFANLVLTANAQGNSITISANGAIVLKPRNNQKIILSTDLGPVQFGNGQPGRYFAGNWNWSRNGQASGSLTPLTAVVNTGINSDYPPGVGFGTGFTGGSFVPYEDGYYDIFMFMNSATAATREACIIRKNGVEIAHNEAPNPTNLATFVIAEFLLQTDTIDFEPFFVSATTPQNLSGRINIARRF